MTGNLKIQQFADISALYFCHVKSTHISLIKDFNYLENIFGWPIFFRRTNLSGSCFLISEGNLTLRGLMIV
jgi:hypothetical protein